MKNPTYITLLPVPIIGCIFAPDNWKTTAFITSHVWMTWAVINLCINLFKLIESNKFSWENVTRSLRQDVICIVAVILSAVVLKYFGKELFNEYTLPITIVCCISKFREMEGKDDKLPEERKAIGYGAGMACSFFEGYLTLILPSTGLTSHLGFQEAISIYESKHSVVFPVKKLFIIITKSLHGKPDFKEYNKSDPRRPFIESCPSLEEHVREVAGMKDDVWKQSLEEQVRDVAGVKNRVYKNSAYVIRRPDKPLNDVYIAVECATPLHTLYKVKRHRNLYKGLADADFDFIVNDFCTMLESILKESEECKGKGVLVYYDDTNDDENLAEVLLKKIEELEPNFEELIQIRN